MRSTWSLAGYALLIALAGLFCPPGHAQTLSVEWLRVEGPQPSSLDTPPPPPQAAVAARWSGDRNGAPIRLDLPRQSGGHWLRLSVDRDIAADEELVISIGGARAFGALAYYPPGATRAVLVSSLDNDGTMLLQQGWELPLRQGFKRGDIAYVRIQGRISSALSIDFTTRAEVARQRLSNRRFTIAAYSALLLMTLFIAGLWAVNREAVYLYYCGYLICISAYMLVMSGWVGVPEHWMSEPARVNGVPWAAATLATVFQIGFTLRFLDLPRWLPRTAKILRAIMWLNLLWLLVLAAAFERIYVYWYIGGNLLLLAAIPLLIYAAVVALRRGAEFAGYYLLGWTPLMAFAGMLAAKTLGWGSVEWTEYGLILAVVLESGVLVMALTQRAARHHRHRMLRREPA
ncbi:7TM-DISM domain-containing protein [Lysobacter sp. 5GHs7-4]|uniref:7TM-DISM domain-containing protein n=1 Tax=Lysobacter sp. 5GHs7-4 TaxID=2904253 RepID=UPI001E2C5FE4|nr:7TM-DISM domain-containing protein [Lysobacter sp. 5GHs7-4]UHQ23486.1 7TM-DISM domain-containing protein [Lysobacter sp. 5GHs7-4]